MDAQASFIDFWKRFAQAIKDVLWYMLAGLVLGTLLVWASTFIHDKFIERMVEHVGMGFIVAAIAIVFYEWRAHMKEIRELMVDLRGLTDPMASDAIQRALKIYLPSIEIRESMVKIIDELKRLQASGDWAQQGHQRFILSMIQNVERNAADLAGISSKLAAGSNASAKLNLLPPVTHVGKLLAAQVQLLPLGGQYNVVAIPNDWHRRQLDALFAECRQAAEKGVEIRRLFVVTNSGENRFEFNAAELRKILDPHVTAASESGSRYVVKVMDASARQQLREEDSEIDDAAEKIFTSHFAIIEHPNAAYCLLIKANDRTLSDVQVESIARAEDNHLLWFRLVWGKLPELDKAKLDEICRRWVPPSMTSGVRAGPVV